MRRKGIGKSIRAPAAEEMDSPDSGGNGDQAAAANCGGGDRRRAAAADDILCPRGWMGPSSMMGGRTWWGIFCCLNFGYEASFVPES